MYRFRLLTIAIFFASYSFSQNDIDAMRYSRTGVGGSARFVAMGGAFGAIGADPSCAAYNPGGLGLIRKGELSFSGSLRADDNVGSIYNTNTGTSAAKFAFNNFSFAYAWNSSTDPESRNVIAFTNTQLQNFNTSVTMTGYTNSSSIAKDMLNLANQTNNSFYFNPSYEGLGYNSYLLDSTAGHFSSLLDTKRSVLQTRTIATTGRVNDLNFSYAYSYKDKFYLGASLGIPRVEYTSTTTHSESDNKDSMRINFNQDTTSYTSTFIGGLPQLSKVYAGLGAFNSLTYTEYFKTTGSGINLKLGGVFRVNDVVRLGIYYHTPTIYSLSDSYYTALSVTFDQNKTTPYNPVQYPSGNGSTGYFSYKIYTPSHLGLNAAFILQKIMVIGVDYELINYRSAHLSSDSAAVFAGVNAEIKNKYKEGQNLRVGAELNVKPVMFRLGYSMQGSPFGDIFVGTFVRNTLSCGVGFRGKSRWYLDLVLSRTFSHEDYYLFTTLDTKATLKYATTTLGATIGVKF